MKIPWFDIDDIRAYVATFVEEIGRVQANGIARGDKPAQIQKRVDKLLEDAARFERENKLNLYKKAQFLALVREGLETRGWSAEQIQTVQHFLITSRLRRKS